jgi:hypothetical protein
MALVFGGPRLESILPERLAIYVYPGNSEYLSLAELSGKQPALTINKPKAILDALQQLRNEVQPLQQIGKIEQTWHILAYRGDKVGYVRIKVPEDNLSRVGIVQPLQHRTSSTKFNQSFIQWIKAQSTRAGGQP